jgi:hypothetical protein
MEKEKLRKYFKERTQIDKDALLETAKIKGY